MKYMGILVTALTVACAFTATTILSVPAQAKTHASDTAKKKKKKKKKHHSAAVSSSHQNRAIASTGYERASLYMKHDDTGKRKKKNKKKHSA